MTNPQEVAGEEVRHARASSWQGTGAQAGDELLVLLGDPSWRVRKAALASFLRRRPDEALVERLIGGLGHAENAGLRSACADALLHLGERAVPGLTRALGTADVDQRKFIVEVLGAAGTPAALGSLLSALEDPDENVRASVVDALGRRGGPAARELLVEQLRSHDSDLQLSAYYLHALARLEARLPVAQLTSYLSRPGLERLVLPLFAFCDDLAAVPLLAEVVRRRRRGTSGPATRALWQLVRRLGEPARAVLGREVAEPALIAELEELLADGEDEVSASAVQLLGLTGDAERAPMLLTAAAYRSFVQQSVDAVRTFGPRAVPVLMRAYDAADIESRVLFLEVIENLGDTSVVPRLIDIAHGNEPRTAEAAVRALAKLAGPEAAPALVELIRRSDPELGRQAALALSSIGIRAPDAVAKQLRQALAAGDLRPAWVSVLGVLGRREDAEVVKHACHDRDPEVRRAAIEALSSFEGDGEEALILALTDEHPRVRAAAARALGSYRSERAVDALLVAANEVDPWVVAEALRALGAVGGPRAAETLTLAASASSSLIAIAALQSLFRLNPESLAAAVERALAHVDPEVVREALVSSMRLPEAVALPMLRNALEHRFWHVRLAAADAIGRRGIRLSDDEIKDRLHGEHEPLVREALRRLLGDRSKLA